MSPSRPIGTADSILGRSIAGDTDQYAGPRVVEGCRAARSWIHGATAAEKDAPSEGAGRVGSERVS